MTSIPDGFGRNWKGNCAASALAVLAMPAIAVAQNGALSPDARRDIEARPGVVQVVTKTEVQGLPCKPALFSGTGFLYRPDGYLVTNGHVAQMANNTDPEAVKAQKALFEKCFVALFEQHVHREPTQADFDRFVKVQGSVYVVLDNGQHYKGEIKAYSGPVTSGGKDIAVIKIDASNLPTVPLGDSDRLNVNDHIFTIGYPGDADVSSASAQVATSSNGIVSALKVRDQTGTPLIQTNAFINHGNSGGPAFDESGAVVGVTTFFKGAEPGFNFLVPISTAQEFIRQAGAEPERGAFDKLWHEALDAYTAGKWSEAHSRLNDLLEMEPGQPEVQKLQVQAASKERGESPLEKVEEEAGIGGLVGIGVVLLALCGLLVWLLARKRGGSGARPGKAEDRLPVMSAAPRVIEATSQPAAPESFGSLHVSGGPLAGNRFPIPKAGLTIGRDPAKCSVVVPEDSVGREHAWVVPLDNGITVIDRNSTNGTYVNSVDSPRINKVVLRHGDRIFLGKSNGTVFTYFSA